MSNVARSQPCQDVGSSKHHSQNSPDSQRMTQEKRERRSTDRKHVGGVESRSIKEEHAGERGRSRSKSPRRNSWREEIKEIKSWKDERENREIKFGDIRNNRQGWNRCRASQRSSKCYIKDVKTSNKFDLLSRRKFTKKDARLVKETPCRQIKKLCEKKERLPPSLVLERRGERLSRWKQVVKKSSNIVNDVEVGLVTRRKGLDKSQTNQDTMDGGGHGNVLGRPSKDSADISDDELELRISDKDVFPELRDEQVDRECAVPDVSNDGMKGKTATKNYEGSDIKMKKPEGDDDTSQRSVKLIDDNDQDVKVEKKTEPTRAWSPVRRDSKLDHEIGSEVMGSMHNEESCPSSSISSASMMSDDDSSAMARNFSLLELKMEVYTTRLKELEWEREQLRKEREVVQDKELFVKRDLVKSLLEQKMLNLDVNLCEKENKENKG